MSKLQSLLKKNKLTLIVSLPQNRVDYAKAAVTGGADALKVHINITHQASKTKFGTLEEEEDNLKKILDVASIPVGLVIGDSISAKEFEKIAAMGFDFIDTFVHYLPTWILDTEGIGKVVAIDENYSIEKTMMINSLPVDAVEAAVIPHSEYGRGLLASDLMLYSTISQVLQSPVIIPTQKKIAVGDVNFLLKAGVKSLMIGIIVTGSEPEKIEKVTYEFKEKIEEIQ